MADTAEGEHAVTDELLKAAIKSLGKTPLGIARKLRELEVRGKRDDSSSCVIASHLQDTWPSERVKVNGIRIFVNGAAADTSPVVASFIDAFDDGAYPDLILHGSGCSLESLVYDEDRALVKCECGGVWKYFDQLERPKPAAQRYLARARAGYVKEA